MALIRTCAAVVTDGVEAGLEVRGGEGGGLLGHRHDHRTVIKNTNFINNSSMLSERNKPRWKQICVALIGKWNTSIKKQVSNTSILL